MFVNELGTRMNVLIRTTVMLVWNDSPIFWPHLSFCTEFRVHKDFSSSMYCSHNLIIKTLAIESSMLRSLWRWRVGALPFAFACDRLCVFCGLPGIRLVLEWTATIVNLALLNSCCFPARSNFVDRRASAAAARSATSRLINAGDM